MVSDKLSLTLFDILGYLLPGFVVLFSLSLLEGTYSEKSSLLSLASLGRNIFIFSIAAYFLGHVCHILATKVKDTFFRIIKPTPDQGTDSSFRWRLKQAVDNRLNSKEDRLSQPIYNRLRQVVQEAYQIPLGEGEKLSTLENYLLADSYILASGCEDERNSLMVREGFFKSSTTAFALLALTIWASLFVGGLRIQVDAGQIQGMGGGLTVFLAVVATMVFFLFRDRFNYYNRMKLNNTYLLFLAYREKDRVAEH